MLRYCQRTSVYNLCMKIYSPRTLFFRLTRDELRDLAAPGDDGGDPSRHNVTRKSDGETGRSRLFGGGLLQIRTTDAETDA